MGGEKTRRDMGERRKRGEGERVKSRGVRG